jgi:hypothetical protein
MGRGTGGAIAQAQGRRGGSGAKTVVIGGERLLVHQVASDGHARLFHGTCSSLLPKIRREGLLPHTYLANDMRLAFSYAEATADDSDAGDGHPVVLEVLADPSALGVDRAALEEPVGYGPRTSASIEELVEGEMEGIEEIDANASLALVGSALHVRAVPARMVGGAYGQAYVDAFPHADSWD